MKLLFFEALPQEDKCASHKFGSFKFIKDTTRQIVFFIIGMMKQKQQRKKAMKGKLPKL
jgi:hypothetical protein